MSIFSLEDFLVTHLLLCIAASEYSTAINISKACIKIFLKTLQTRVTIEELASGRGRGVN
jgi:hypothetical protein